MIFKANFKDLAGDVAKNVNGFFFGGGECRFYFDGREDFSDSCLFL